MAQLLTRLDRETIDTLWLEFIVCRSLDVDFKHGLLLRHINQSYNMLKYSYLCFISLAHFLRHFYRLSLEANKIKTALLLRAGPVL